MNNKYTKICPSCGCILSYSSKCNMIRSEKNKSLCSSCWQKGEKNPNFGKHLTLEIKQKLSKSHMGNIVSDRTKQKISKKMCGENNHRYGKHNTEEHNQKLRIIIANRIKKYGTTAKNFNPKACEFIDKLNKEKGWNLQHVLNGGEYSFLGYFVDGYDKERNIIVEYDEPIHNSMSKKKKDIIRQQNIIDFLNPNLFFAI